MPKNKGKGGKNRRRGKNEYITKRELLVKEPEQEYAQVNKMLGNGRLEAQCMDGLKRLCHIRGKLRRRVWICAGDIVLLGLREFQDGKADVIHKYNADEVHELKRLNEIPQDLTVNEENNEEEQKGGKIVFVNQVNEMSDEESGSEDSFDEEEDFDNI